MRDGGRCSTYSRTAEHQNLWTVLLVLAMWTHEYHLPALSADPYIWYENTAVLIGSCPEN